MQVGKSLDLLGLHPPVAPSNPGRNCFTLTKELAHYNPGRPAALRVGLMACIAAAGLAVHYMSGIVETGIEI